MPKDQEPNRSWSAVDLLTDSCARIESSNRPVEREDWGYRVYNKKDEVETHVYFLSCPERFHIDVT